MVTLMKRTAGRTLRPPCIGIATLALVALTAGAALVGCGTNKMAPEGTQSAAKEVRSATEETSSDLVAEGQRIFSFDTFGDEQFWTDTLRLNEVVEKNVDPTTALAVGLKVDVDVLPPGILKKVDLKSPATTVALLKMNAIVGIQATVDSNNHITRLGITCALCHSTVDNSVMPGIGRRKDGWPNRNLNVGAIIALSPALPADKKAVYESWGPGKYDPRFNLDGKNTPLVIPPAYGLAQVKNETYTAEGPISYWNAYVAVTQMHGRGNFSDPRLGIDIKQSPDMVGPKLAALRTSSIACRPLHRRPQASMPLLRSVDARCLTRHAQPATWVRPAPITTAGSCTQRRKPASTGRTRRARQTRRTAQPLCVHCGSTLRTSTTAPRPRSRTSWHTTTGFARSGSPRSSSETWSSI
jgi:hypothetical protein